MARKPREDVEGAIQHVYARGVRRTPLFRDEADHHRYLAMLARACRRYGWACLSYCLMPNHVHLLIETPRANLGHGMSWFHGGYARRFNDRYGTTGHVFEARYGSTRMLSDRHLWTAVRYVVRNPVEAGLCAVPAEWRWSSHTRLHRDAVPPWLSHHRLLELLSGAGGDPTERYAELVRI